MEKNIPRLNTSGRGARRLSAKAAAVPRATTRGLKGNGRSRPQPARPVDAPGRRRLPPLLRRAWFSLNQTFRRFSAKAGITPDQFTVLRTLMEHEPVALTQRELAERITSDPNTVTSLLKRMEDGGLIARRSDPEDGRAQLVHLTPAGRDKYDQARPLAAELQSRVLRALPEPRREMFLRELETIANACQEALKSWR